MSPFIDFFNSTPKARKKTNAFDVGQVGMPSTPGSTSLGNTAYSQARPVNTPTVPQQSGGLIGAIGNTFASPAFRKALGAAGAALSPPNTAGRAAGETAVALSEGQAYDTTIKKLSQGVPISEIEEAGALTPAQTNAALEQTRKIDESRYKRTDAFTKRLTALDKMLESGKITRNEHEVLRQNIIEASGIPLREIAATEKTADAAVTRADADVTRSKAYAEGVDKEGSFEEMSAHEKDMLKMRFKHDLDMLGLQNEAKALEQGFDMDSFRRYESVIDTARQKILDQHGNMFTNVDGQVMLTDQASPEIAEQIRATMISDVANAVQTGVIPGIYLDLVSRQTKDINKLFANKRRGVSQDTEGATHSSFEQGSGDYLMYRRK